MNLDGFSSKQFAQNLGPPWKKKQRQMDRELLEGRAGVGVVKGNFSFEIIKFTLPYLTGAKRGDEKNIKEVWREDGVGIDMAPDFHQVQRVGIHTSCAGHLPTSITRFSSLRYVAVYSSLEPRFVGLVVKASRRKRDSKPVSALRAEDPGFESRLHRDFSGVESYQ